MTRQSELTVKIRIIQPCADVLCVTIAQFLQFVK